MFYSGNRRTNLVSIQDIYPKYLHPIGFIRGSVLLASRWHDDPFLTDATTLWHTAPKVHLRMALRHLDRDVFVVLGNMRHHLFHRQLLA